MARLVVVAVLVSTAAAAAEIDPDMRVVVRTYNTTELPDAKLEAAVGTATGILQGSGFGLTWHACEEAFVRSAEHPCAAPLGANEFAVRIVRLTTDAAYRGELPLGYSLVDTATRSGALATISIDRVTWLAGAAGVDATLLLGRAIAHELGHLLLGTNAHSATGLMRAVWSCDALQRNTSLDWLFAPADVSAMRQAVHLRAVFRLARAGLRE